MEEFIFPSEKSLSTVLPNSQHNWINYPFANGAIQHIQVKNSGTYLKRNIQRINL